MISCQTCFFAEQQNGQLVCVRFPPMPTLVMNRNALTQQPEPVILAIRPNVQPTWYCGEYSTDDQAENKGLSSPSEGGL